MKRCKIQLLVLLASIALAPTAFGGQQQTVPNESYYVGLNFGPAIPSGSKSGPIKTGFNFGGHFGYRVNPFRVEGAVTYYHNTVSGSSNNLSMLSFMLNGFYDLPFSYKNFTPFFGSGFGLLHIANRVGPASKGAHFAYQLIPGISYQINQQFSVNLNYRFLDWTGDNIHENMVNIGVNMNFG